MWKFGSALEARVEVSECWGEQGGREGTARRHHADRRWLEGVVWREHKGSPVLSAFIRGVFGTGDNEVPSIRVCVNMVR